MHEISSPFLLSNVFSSPLPLPSLSLSLSVDGFLLLNEEDSAMVFQVPGTSSSFVSALPEVSPPILFTGLSLSLSLSLFKCA